MKNISRIAGETGYAERTVNVLAPLSTIIADSTASSTSETGGDTPLESQEPLTGQASTTSTTP
ncbi:MAG: hypothetical protein Q7S05_03095 [bacterium]|nr:hypothetical protein [bacterium]